MHSPHFCPYYKNDLYCFRLAHSTTPLPIVLLETLNKMLTKLLFDNKHKTISFTFSKMFVWKWQIQTAMSKRQTKVNFDLDFYLDEK